MFLARMVSGLICSKNSKKHANNSNQKQVHQQTCTQQCKSGKKSKKCKDADKAKRPLATTESKKSVADLLQAQMTSVAITKELPIKESLTKSNASNWKRIEITAVTTPSNVASMTATTATTTSTTTAATGAIVSVAPTASNGKKSKSTRKCTAAWLKFSTSSEPAGISKPSILTEYAAPVCKPLYSDVVFGAGCSNFVKVKTLTTPSTVDSNAVNAKLKSSSNETQITGCEVETDLNVFPTLSECHKSLVSATVTPAVTTVASNSVTLTSNVSGGACSPASTPVPVPLPLPLPLLLPLSLSPPAHGIAECNKETLSLGTGLKKDEEVVAAVGVGVSAGEGAGAAASAHILDEAFVAQKSTVCGTFMEQSYSGAASSKEPSVILEALEIPRWNYYDFDFNGEFFPKFLCQFEDEHYLEAEQMALVSLKLALGNSTQQSLFKF